MSNFQASKALILAYFDALENAQPEEIETVLQRYYAADHRWYGSYPFRDLSGVQQVTSEFWAPLLTAFSSLQRRQDIFIAGTNDVAGDEWVMSMGHFMGLFDGQWLGLQGHRKLVMLRYAEFNCVVDGKITQTGVFLDLLGLMHQVGINPLPQSTGATFVFPGPRTHDGLVLEPQPPEEARATLDLVNLMVDDLNELNKTGEDRCPPEFLARTWHDRMVWFGPTGIGGTYTIERYQEQHQYPFREGLTDKTYNGHICRFAEGNYACFFGWPNLTNTPTGGFLGLPAGKRADMQVVDVYRREGDKLMENWVIIDFPWWLKQQGIDVLVRGVALGGATT